MGERHLDVFDVKTAVGNGEVPREALPTGAIEPVIEIQQAEPSTAMRVAVDDAALARAPAEDDLAVATEPAVAVDPAVAADAARMVPAVASDGAVVVDTSVAGDADLSTKLTERMPELVDVPPPAPAFVRRTPVTIGAAFTDRIARMRGLRPITRPAEDVDDHARSGRGWFYAALAISAAAIAVSATVVMWARDEVRQARTAQHAPPPANLVAKAPPPPAPPAAAALTEAPPPPSCSVRVISSVDDAIVWIGGERKARVPAELPVPCGQQTAVEVRRQRYQEFKSAVVVSDGTVVIDARLERKRRRH